MDQFLCNKENQFSFYQKAMFYDKNEDGSIDCHLCPHACNIKPDNYGNCRVRKNDKGNLITYSWGHSSGLAIDPIEKKPFFHFHPGSKVMSFGTPGCNLKCENCQNWELSAHKKEDNKNLSKFVMMPLEIANSAVANGCQGVAYTYSEPTIFFEYAYDVIKETRKLSSEIFHVFVSNGYMSDDVIDFIIKEKLIDAINIDLKFTTDKQYQKIAGGTLAPVLNSINRFYKSGIHVEIINLVISGLNDYEKDFEEISKFIMSVSPEIPLHFSRFLPAYKMKDRFATEIKRLEKAKEIAEQSGLKHVYIGNSNLQEVQDTSCPSCGNLLIARDRYQISKNIFKSIRREITPHCPFCKTKLNLIL
jgi:pyruvate formate lyase activating enzyme